MDFRAACYCYSQLLQLVCYASRALIIFRFSRNFLGATVTCMSSLSSILLIQNRTNSLIQNRTNDFCASFAYLRRKALHPSSQSIACANAKLCNRQRKALHPPTQSIASAHAKLCMFSHRTYTQGADMLCLGLCYCWGFSSWKLLFISLKAVPLCSECFR